MKVTKLYQLFRKILFEIFLYFLLQALMMLILAFLVLVYPYTLNVLVALGFFIIAIISAYLMVRVICLMRKVKKIKELILGKE